MKKGFFKKFVSSVLIGMMCVPTLVMAAPNVNTSNNIESEIESTIASTKQEILSTKEVKDVEVSTEKVKVQVLINNCDLSFGNDKDTVSIGNIKFDVYDAKKEKVISSYTFKASDVENSKRFNTSKVFELEVPSWKDGDIYYVKVNGLNTSMFKEDEFYELKYKTIIAEDYEVDPTTGEEKPVGNTITQVVGKDISHQIIINAKGYMVCVRAIDVNSKALSGARVVLIDDEGNQYKGVTGANGRAYIPFNKKSSTLAITIDNMVNGYVFNQVNEYVYHNRFAEMVFYDIRMTEKASDLAGQINFKSVYKNVYNSDLLKKSVAPIEIKVGDTIVDVVSISENDATNYRVLEAGTYSLSVSEEVKDFSLAFSNANVTVNGESETNVTVTATPKLGLKIINTVNGTRQNNNFTVVGFDKTYTGNNENIFDVNSDTVYTILNKDTNKEFTVTISGNYKMTTLDIGTGRILYDGNYLGEDDINDIPKTNDAIFYYLCVAGAGVLVLSGLFYVVSKRRNVKN